MSTKIYFRFITSLTLLLSALLFNGEAQTYTLNPYMPGTTCSTCLATNINKPKGNNNNTIMNGNGNIVNSYMATACGLNYVLGQVKLGKRIPSPGPNQPCAISISGLPPCNVILKAFLYTGGSGNGLAFSSTVQNPAATSSVFPMTMIGQDVDKCWGYTGTYNYRADITALISGNGNYNVSGIPTSPPSAGNDMDGASIIIVYRDLSQLYTGHIVIGDGCQVGIGAQVNNTLGGWSACAASTFANAFMIVSDLQNVGNANCFMNSATSNFTYPSATQDWWDNIVMAGSPAITSGQTTAGFGLLSGGDCFNIVAEGLYYRTNCSACTIATGLTVTASSTPSCPTSNATVTVAGGTAPYSYTWTPSAQSTSVATGLSSGTYTVFVKDATGCLTGSATVNVVTAALTPITVNSGTICQTFSANLNASGASTYTWSPPASLNTSNGPNVVASPAATQIYTISFTNPIGCVGTQTTQVLVNPTPTITIANVTVCAGQPINLTANSLAGATYSWSGPGGFSSNVQNPVIAASTTLMTGPYNLTVTSTAGCKNTAVANVTVFALPVPAIGSNAPICATNNLNLTGSGGATYNWVGPNGFTSLLQNPTITNASTLATGVYTLTASNNGCSVSTTSLLTINPLPTPTLTSNTPICNGLSLNLGASGGNTYSWTGPAAFTSTLQNPVINPASPANSGIYTLTAISVNGCTATVTSSITINPTPTISTTGATVCLNTTINLFANSLAGSTYSWSGPGGYTSNAQNPIIANATLTMSGVYNLTVTSSVGCVNTATANVTVLSLPAPSITSNAPVCFGSALTLTAGGGLTYQWNGPNGFNSTSATPTINNITLAGSGNYSLIAFVGTCSANISQSITVNALPTPTASNNGPICNGQTLNLNSSASVTYTWTGPAAFTSNSQNPTIAIASPSNSGVYTVTVTDVNSCKNFTTTNVTVNPTPTLSAQGSSICVGQNMSINANSIPGSVYAWTGPGGFTAIAQNTVITNAQVTMTGVYNVTVTSSVGCTNTAVANVLVIALPTPSIVANTPCAGATLTLNVIGSAGASFIWTGPNGFNSLIQNPSITNVTVPASGMYTVIATAGICSVSTIQSVTVNPLPVPTAVNNGPICETKNLFLTATGGTSYSWTGPSGFNSAVSNPSISATINTQSGLYIVTVTNANGCQAVANTSVTILANPSALANGATVCFGKPATLSATGGASYSWVGPAGFTSNVANPTIPIVNNLTTGNYTVTVTGVNTCTSITIANVVANPLPIPTITSTARACINNQINLQGPPGFLLYQWTGPNNFLSPNVSTSFTASGVSDGGVYTLGVTDNNGCQGFTSTVVIIDPFPTANLLSDNNKNCVPFCSNFSLSAAAGSASIVSSSWLINGQGFNGSTLNYCISQAGKYLVKASFVDANGCPNSTTYTITAYPVPVANFEYSPYNPIENVDNVLFDDVTKGDSLNSWSWYFVNNNNYVQTSQNPSYLFAEAGSYPVALIVKNKWGCADTVVKSIVVGEDNSFYVPNAFTPNGDGMNDTFFPKGHGILKYDMMIFDRWGERLFATSDFFQSWDGTFKGVACKEDVYVWKIHVTLPNSKVKTYTGHVTLNK
ncbi:MAG: gliding motility-associated C-terminal domain-containing protein [Bacteroidetes bacterium]|nr:gliding motility-associated C-terminal domain-containing protein [Bacteroidota bacterium]